MLYEDARVVQTIYVPSRHGKGSDIAPTITMGGEGGFGFGASFVDVKIDIPQKYAVVFECQHGKFISEGEDKRHKDLWSRLKEGQNVDITYRELYRTTYKDVDGDGKKDVIERRLVGYDFLDAQPKK